MKFHSTVDSDKERFCGLISQICFFDLEADPICRFLHFTSLFSKHLSLIISYPSLFLCIYIVHPVMRTWKGVLVTWTYVYVIKYITGKRSKVLKALWNGRHMLAFIVYLSVAAVRDIGKETSRWLGCVVVHVPLALSCPVTLGICTYSETQYRLGNTSTGNTSWHRCQRLNIASSSGM